MKQEMLSQWLVVFIISPLPLSSEQFVISEEKFIAKIMLLKPENSFPSILVLWIAPTRSKQYILQLCLENEKV